MEVFETHEGAVTVLKPAGPLTAGELDQIENKLMNLMKNRQQRIVIDLNESTFVDSAALELFVRYQNDLNAHGLHLKLCGLTETTQTIFDLTKLSRRFEIFPDTAIAVRSYL